MPSGDEQSRPYHGMAAGGHPPGLYDLDARAGPPLPTLKEAPLNDRPR